MVATGYVVESVVRVTLTSVLWVLVGLQLLNERHTRPPKRSGRCVGVPAAPRRPMLLQHCCRQIDNAAARAALELETVRGLVFLQPAGGRGNGSCAVAASLA